MAKRELDHADQNWGDAVEEKRWQRQEEAAGRQVKMMGSAKRAAFFTAVAALASALAAIIEIAPQVARWFAQVAHRLGG